MTLEFYSINLLINILILIITTTKIHPKSWACEPCFEGKTVNTNESDNDRRSLYTMTLRKSCTEKSQSCNLCQAYCFVILVLKKTKLLFPLQQQSSDNIQLQLRTRCLVVVNGTNEVGQMMTSPQSTRLCSTSTVCVLASSDCIYLEYKQQTASQPWPNETWSWVFCMTKKMHYTGDHKFGHEIMKCEIGYVMTSFF